MNTSHKQTAWTALGVALLATTSAGYAADGQDDSWKFAVTVPVFAAGIDGNATVLGHTKDVNISFDQLKDHLDASAALAFDAHKGKFGLFSDVGYMKFSGGGAVAHLGLKFLIADAGASYLLVKTESEHPFVLAGTVGLRYWYADSTIVLRDEHGGLLFNGDTTYNLFDPVVGVRASQYFTQKLHLDFSGDIGGFDINNNTDFTWSAAGVVTYDFCKWFSLSAGYKALALDESKNGGAVLNGVNIIMNGALIAAQFKF